MCDASEYTVEAVLWHNKDMKLHVIYYASHTFDDAQMKYAQQKKLLAMVLSLRRG